jgi:hypothetical protein
MGEAHLLKFKSEPIASVGGTDTRKSSKGVLFWTGLARAVTEVLASLALVHSRAFRSPWQPHPLAL